MPDNKYSPKVELCEVENIGVYKFNIFCIKSDELQLLKILSANKVVILCYVDHFIRFVTFIAVTVVVTESCTLFSSGPTDPHI